MQRYVVLGKKVGETPLSCMEAWRSTKPGLTQTPLAYAGRLDPMASGKLLVLIGPECKQQEHYHQLDKQYDFDVLFAIASDSADVLGITQAAPTLINQTKNQLGAIAHTFRGPIALPFPHFSAKPVNGKPLHTWAVEGRLNEITIPTQHSTIYKLTCTGTRTISTPELKALVQQKIESIPPVTDPRKALGNDFRRPEVRASWQRIFAAYPNRTYTIGSFTCIASSGTYMRSLAEVISQQAGTSGLALSIHRTKIGRYVSLPFGLGFWRKQYK